MINKRHVVCNFYQYFRIRSCFGAFKNICTLTFLTFVDYRNFRLINCKTSLLNSISLTLPMIIIQPLINKNHNIN